MGAPILFFRYDGRQGWDPGPLLSLRRAQQPAVACYWQPSLRQPFVPGRPDPRLWAFSGMHVARLFGTRDYGAMMIGAPGGKCDHASLVFPRFGRFPFMKGEDLQIGATFTDPPARGRGLALRAIWEILDRFARPDRDFWYLTEAANRPSVAVVEKAGFRLAGEGGKHPRMGLMFFGFYDISRPSRADGEVVDRHS